MQYVVLCSVSQLRWCIGLQVHVILPCVTGFTHYCARVYEALWELVLIVRCKPCFSSSSPSLAPYLTLLPYYTLNLPSPLSLSPHLTSLTSSLSPCSQHSIANHTCLPHLTPSLTCSIVLLSSIASCLLLYHTCPSPPLPLLPY